MINLGSISGLVNINSDDSRGRVAKWIFSEDDGRIPKSLIKEWSMGEDLYVLYSNDLDDEIMIRSIIEYLFKISENLWNRDITENSSDTQIFYKDCMVALVKSYDYGMFIVMNKSAYDYIQRNYVECEIIF